MVENIQMVPRARISERIEVHIVDIPVPSIEKETANVMLSSHVAAHAAPTPVNDYVALACDVNYATPAAVIDYESPSPVFEYIRDKNGGITDSAVVMMAVVSDQSHKIVLLKTLWPTLCHGDSLIDELYSITTSIP